MFRRVERHRGGLGGVGVGQGDGLVIEIDQEDLRDAAAKLAPQERQLLGVDDQGTGEKIKAIDETAAPARAAPAPRPAPPAIAPPPPAPPRPK